MPVKERITLTIDPAVLARIDAVAAARQESRSSTVERILRNGVEDEEETLDTLGEGFEGRVVAYLLKSPQTLRKLAKVVGEEISAEHLARIESEGPGVVDAARRYRSSKDQTAKGETK